jgi:hypothetical protein
MSLIFLFPLKLSAIRGIKLKKKFEMFLSIVRFKKTTGRDEWFLMVSNVVWNQIRNEFHTPYANYKPVFSKINNQI